MSSVKETQIVEKLHQGNYANWKFKIEMLLIKEDLYDIISTDPPNPITPEWRKRDNKARALINLSISDSQIIYVKNLTTSRETWETLKGIHERSNLSSKLFLLRKLYSIKLSEQGNMNVHITKILETVDKLKSIGEEIKDSHIAALFLCSLPGSYETLITALEARPEEELTPDFISSKLKDEYNRRHEGQESNENAAKAFHINKKHNTSYNNYSQKQNNKYCNYCKRKNHNRSECWHLKKKELSNKNNYNQNKYKNNSSSLCLQPNSKNEIEIKNDRQQSNNFETIDQKLNELALLISQSETNTWVIDSGSSTHLTNDKQLFTKINNYQESEVMIANGQSLTSYCKGDIKLMTQTSKGQTTITLKDTLYVPELKTNLLSVSKAAQNGCEIIFKNEKCKINYKDKTIIQAELKNNIYTIMLDSPKQQNQANLAYECNNKNCINLWHRRTGHRYHESLKQLEAKQLAEDIKINKCNHNIECEICIKTKLTDTPYPKQAQNRATEAMQLIHTDICGPIQTPTIGGKTYFMTVIDDYSRYTTVYLLNKKSEAFTKLKEYIAFTKNKFGKIPQVLRSDNGGEYTSQEMEDYLTNLGMQRQFSVPFCAPQNGVAERKNRSLLDMTRSMLRDANLESKFWGEALNTANYIQNRIPTKGNSVTPYEAWHKRKPSLSHFRIFGCKAFAYIHKNKRGKLDDKAIQGKFMGYDEQSKAYRIYIEGKNIIKSRAVKFIETPIENIIGEVEKEQNTTDEKSQSLNTDTENNTETIELEINPSIDKSQQSCTQKDNIRRSDRSNKGVPPDRLAYIAFPSDTNEPKSFEDVMNIPNKIERENWLKAMDEEMKSLKENNTWTLSDPPTGRKVIGCRWTYKTKRNEKGEVEKYKARLVAKGYSQKFGEDFYETFAPVVSYTTIRSFLAAAAYEKREIYHVDIKTAFLHGDLDEEIYMCQPEGYEIQGQENKACMLNKAIYGLKQAARAWHLKIGTSLNKLGFVQSTIDPCLFKKNQNGENVFIIVYVDDLLISGTKNQINQVIENLNKDYELKNLGEIKHYLGINICKNDAGEYQINQKNKIEELVNKFHLTDSKPHGIPMEPGYSKTDSEENILQNNTKYRQAIGALLYISTISRPDITAAVNMLSRRNEKPRQLDWNTVKRVITYLNTTKNLNLIIGSKQPPILKVYADADWAGDKNDRKSTSGNLFMLGNSPIQWLSKKQTCVALSSAEAEFISIGNAAQEILWITKLLEDLNMKQEQPIMIYEDNQSTIKMVESPKHTPRTKHIDLRYHLIRDLKEKGIVTLEYCPTKQMVADVLTKPLPKPQFIKHREELKLMNT